MRLPRKRVDAEPWNRSLRDRLDVFEISNKSKVAYIYEQADTSTFRYRVYNMCQALEYSESWAGSYFFEDELSILSGYLDRIDVVVFVRIRWSLTIDAFLRKAKRRMIPVLFDIDDLVCDLSSLPLVMNTVGVDFEDQESYRYWFSYASRLWLTGSLCDATIGTNEYLCERLSHLFGRASFAIGNFLNMEQIRVSESLFAKRKKENGRPFVIGYFSGSPSHSGDFRKVAPEVAELLWACPDTILEIVGFLDLPDVLDYAKREKQIIRYPLVDFLTLQTKMAEADVNIVPLVDNSFTNCKSELKFFEGALVGTITCATPTFTYRNSVEHGKTGFLCEEGQWYSTIEGIYRNGYPDGMLARARNYCLNRYAPLSQVSRIEEVLNTVASAKSGSKGLQKPRASTAIQA